MTELFAAADITTIVTFVSPSRRRSAIVLALGLITSVLALRGWLAWVAPLPGDRLLATLRYDPMPLPVRGLDAAFRDLAAPQIAFVTLVVAMLIVGRVAGGQAAAGVLLAAAVVIASTVIKYSFGPTPLWRSLGAGGVNYPSGHTAYATAVFGYLAVVARARDRKLLAVFLAMLVAGMGPSRILSGTHLLSDVVAGYLLGLGWLLLVLAWGTPRPVTCSP